MSLNNNNNNNNIIYLQIFLFRVQIRVTINTNLKYFHLEQEAVVKLEEVFMEFPTMAVVGLIEWSFLILTFKKKTWLKTVPF